MGLLDTWASRLTGPGPEHTPHHQHRPRPLTAAGARINLRSPDLVHTRHPEWQNTAWDYRDEVPELRFAGDFITAALGRLRVYPAENRPRGQEPVPLVDGTVPDGITKTPAIEQATREAAKAAIDRLDLDRHGSSLLARMGENLEFAGECYLLGEAGDEGEQWTIRSVSELVVTQGGARLIEPGHGGGASRELKPDEVELLRLWNPHPRYYDWPDAAISALLTTLEGMVILGRRGRAHDRSRISSGTALFVPDEFSLTRAGDASEVDEDDDPFMTALAEAMMAPIRDESDPSTVVPVVIRGPGTLGDKYGADMIKTVQLHSEDPSNLDERYEALVQRFARGISMPPEILKGVGDTNHWCVDEQTEILTERGWLTHDRLAVGDIALTLNHETGLSEWQPVRDVYRADVDDEPMLRSEGRWHSSRTTANHRWPVLHLRGGKRYRDQSFAREWTTSGELGYQDRILTAAPSGDRPMTAKWDDAFAELVGWFWTEGCVRQGRAGQAGGLWIGQSSTANPDNVARIRRALHDLLGAPNDGPLTNRHGGVPRWHETARPDGMAMFTLNVPAAAPFHDVAPGKVVRREFIRELTDAQLRIFIEASVRGDGTIMSGVTPVILQKRRDVLEAFELASILVGRSTNFYPHSRTDGTVDWIVTTRARMTYQPDRRSNGFTWERYTGAVWCPVLPNGTWFARRRGTTYFTGNSAAVIDSTVVKNYIEPRAERMVDALTAAYFRPALKAMGVPPEQRNRVCLWFDPSELVQNPNREQAAKDAHGAGVISDAALRGELGFTEEHKPDPVEQLRRSVDRERLSPASVPILVKTLTGRLPDERDMSKILGEFTQSGQPRIVEGQTGRPVAPGRSGRLDTPAGVRSAPSTGGPDGPGAVAASGKRKGPRDDPEGPSVAGLALMAQDTGRVLMLQRAVDDESDPAAGTWEFPGGHIEDGDETSLHGAMREWSEEVGQAVPSGGAVVHTWTSPDGVYQGHVVVISSEDDLDLGAKRKVHNPDDAAEQCAWWEPEHARKNPALRRECKRTPWSALKRAAKTVRSPVTAAAASGRYKVDEAACRRLAQIDRALTDRLVAHAEATVGRAVERAANRIRGRAQKDPLTAAAFPAGCDPVAVCAAAGRDVQGDLSDDAILAGALDEFATRWETETSHAAEQTAAVVAGMVGKQAAAGLIDRLVEGARRAWGWLKGRLHRHITQVLYGDTDADPVPTQLVRGALTIAGGLPEGSPGVDDAGAPAAAPGQTATPLAGPATGTTTSGTIRDGGAEQLGWVWGYHGLARKDPFLPHRALDGRRFAGFDDPALAPPASAAFVGPRMYPGDHQGCLCSVEVIWATPTGEDRSSSEGRDLAALDETPEMRRIRELAESDDATGRTNTTAQRDRDAAAEIAALRRQHIGAREGASA